MRSKIALAAMGATLVLASTMGTAFAQDQTRSSSAATAAGSNRVVQPLYFSGPDAAIKAWDQCQHGQACLFQNSNGGGTLWVVPSCNQIWNLDASMNNRTSSLWNRAGSTLNVYNGNGGNTFLASYGKFGPPINLPGTFNDKISSVYAPCGG